MKEKRDEKRRKKKTKDKKMDEEKNDEMMKKWAKNGTHMGTSERHSACSGPLSFPTDSPASVSRHGANFLALGDIPNLHQSCVGAHG